MPHRLKYFCSLIILSIAIFFSQIDIGHAITLEDIPQPIVTEDRYTVDLAGILDRETEEKIDRKIALLKRKKNKVIYLISIPKVPDNFTSTKPNVIPFRTASRKFLESILLEWKIPELQQGNGVLILFSTGDRSIEIRSAASLKYILKDRYIQGVIDSVLVPSFQEGNFNKGSLSAIDLIVKKITNPYFNSIPSSKTKTVQSIVLDRCIQRFNRHLPEEYGIFGRSLANCFNKTIGYFGGSGTW